MTQNCAKKSIHVAIVNYYIFSSRSTFIIKSFTFVLKVFERILYSVNLIFFLKKKLTLFEICAGEMYNSGRRCSGVL